MAYQDINAATIDRWIKEEDWEWGRAISHEDYIKALNGEWDVKLTPVKFVPHEWFGDLKGKKLLGLASGGGQQIPVFTALGAECTVLDYSDMQLENLELLARPRFSSTGFYGKLIKDRDKIYFKYNKENAHNAKGQHIVFFYDGFVVGGGEIK